MEGLKAKYELASEMILVGGSTALDHSARGKSAYLHGFAWNGGEVKEFCPLETNQL